VRLLSDDDWWSYAVSKRTSASAEAFTLCLRVNPVSTQGCEMHEAVETFESGCGEIVPYLID
jgi:hypothetical protein